LRSGRIFMTREEMKLRTQRYALRVIKAAQAAPQNRVAGALAVQLVRCGASVGANYRAACRAKSTADFINKLKIVEEECDESLYWMELFIEAGLIKKEKLADLRHEGGEILAIIVASLKTSRVAARADAYNGRMMSCA